MKKTISILSLALALVFLLAGCSRHANQGDATTSSLDNLLQAIDKENVKQYKQSFPPDFIEKLHTAFEQLGSNLDDMIGETLSAATEAREANFGKKCTVYYKLIGKTDLSSEEIYAPYWDLFLDGYYLPAGITEGFTAELEITISGKDSTETRKAEMIFLKIDNNWCLHPKNFMNVFSA